MSLGDLGGQISAERQMKGKRKATGLSPRLCCRASTSNPTRRCVCVSANSAGSRKCARGRKSVGRHRRAAAADNPVGVHRAFVNVPYAFLTAGLCRTLPPDRVVLEILETVQVDRDVVQVARGLVADGHTLALDDFVFRDGMEELVELADIVKLDVLALSSRELVRQVDLLRRYGVTL